MKNWVFYCCVLVVWAVSCTDHNEPADLPAVGGTVDLDFQLASDVESRAPLTETEKKITHFYAFVVGAKQQILQRIVQDVHSAADLAFHCPALPTDQFPITLHVFANLKCEGFTRKAFMLSNVPGGFFYDDGEVQEAAKSGRDLDAFGVIHMSDFSLGPTIQTTDLPKIGIQRVELSQAHTPLSIKMRNVVAKIDITNSLQLQSLNVWPRVKFYPFKAGAVATPFNPPTSSERNLMQYPADKLAASELVVYILPGKGHAEIEKTGIDYTLQGGKSMSLLLPLTIQSNMRYARSLSALGISVTIPNHSDPEAGVKLLQEQGTLTVEVDSDVPYTLSLDGSWLIEQPVTSQGPTKKIHTFRYNQQDLIAQATITVRDGSGTFRKVIPVTYTPRDGEVKLLYPSTRPRTIAIVVVGDGFRPVDNRAGNIYDQKAKEVVDRLLSYAPFAQYKEYFTVYQVYANSVDAGADCDQSASVNMNNQKNTAFNATFWTSDVQRLLTLQDTYKVRQYVQQVGLLPNDPAIVVGLVNSQVYGGSGGIQAVSSCNGRAPLIAIHEIGHLFSLADEYVDDAVAALHGYTPLDADNWPNVDNTNDHTKVKWRHFIGREGYPQSDAWTVQGGLYLRDGVWRSSLLSMMVTLEQGFNAISRETIVRKIMLWCGETYDFNQFLERDKSRSAAATSTHIAPFDTSSDAQPMPVPLEYYVLPRDMPAVRTRDWGPRP